MPKEVSFNWQVPDVIYREPSADMQFFFTHSRFHLKYCYSKSAEIATKVNLQQNSVNYI